MLFIFSDSSNWTVLRRIRHCESALFSDLSLVQLGLLRKIDGEEIDWRFVLFCHLDDQGVELLAQDFHRFLGLFSHFLCVLQLDLQQFLQLFVLLFERLVLLDFFLQLTNVFALFLVFCARVVLIVFKHWL